MFYNAGIQTRLVYELAEKCRMNGEKFGRLESNLLFGGM